MWNYCKKTQDLISNSIRFVSKVLLKWLEQNKRESFSQETMKIAKEPCDEMVIWIALELRLSTHIIYSYQYG